MIRIQTNECFFFFFFFAMLCFFVIVIIDITAHFSSDIIKGIYYV